jgi:hypothetical protein
MTSHEVNSDKLDKVPLTLFQVFFYLANDLATGSDWNEMKLGTKADGLVCCGTYFKRKFGNPFKASSFQ